MTVLICMMANFQSLNIKLKLFSISSMNDDINLLKLIGFYFGIFFIIFLRFYGYCALIEFVQIYGEDCE